MGETEPDAGTVLLRRAVATAPGRIALAAVSIFATAFGSIELTRNAQHISTFWLANAVLLALLLRTPTRFWAQFLLGGLLGDAAAHLWVADPLPLCFGLPASNVAGVLGIAAGLRRWIGRDLDLSRLSHLGAFVATAGVLAPAGASAAAAVLVGWFRHTSTVTVWTTWYPVSALGFLVFTPPLLMRGPAGLRSLLRPGRRGETAAWFAALAVVSAMVFAQNRYPLLFLPTTVLALLGVRLGPAGTALGIGFVTVSAALATLNGHGPMMLAASDSTLQSFLLQGFIAATVLGNLPLTALLSDLARLDAKAREANRHLQLAETIARMGHWRLDVAADRLTWSDGVYGMRGLDPATFVPTLAAAVAGYHPDDRAKVARAVEEAIRSGVGYDLSCRIVLGDGTERDVLVRGTCETGPGGRVTALFGTVMDVTDLRRAERAAVDSEARYRLLADNTTDMITHMDLTGRRLFVSPGSRDLLGYEAAELVDTNPHEMIHPDDAPGLRALFADFAAGSRERAVNVNRLKHRDGRWIWIEASLRLLRGDDGTASGVVGCMRDITGRKLADEVLRRSEERYRLLADNASDMITHMDLTGRRLFVSPGSRDLVGYEPEELVGTPRADFVHPDDEPGLRRKLDDLAAGRTSRVANINRIRHKDGWWIWIEASVKLLRDAEGRPSGLVSALRDVTDRKLADEALRRSEERYRLLADNSTDLIALKADFAGPRPYVSPSVHAMTGYTADEFSVLSPADYVHPDDQARVAAEFATLTPDHAEVTSLHRVRHKAGRWLWVESDFRLIETGGPGRTVLVRSRDVTVRHQAELALAASEARYRVLAETTSDVITQLDLDLRRRYVSPSCRTMLGFEPEEMLDVRPSTRMHPEDAPRVRALALRLVAGEIEGDRATVTYRSLHKRGHWVGLEALMTLVRDHADGAPASVICSLRDVTERQRTARHLERAKAEAEAAARAKTEFVANMSHELRTPLTGIIGVHDLLRGDAGLTPAQRRLVDLAGEAGRSLLTIVNDVLDFSKVDAGQLTLERVPFDLDDLVASCCDLARGQLDGKPVALSAVRIPRSLGRVVGDPTRVRQVLLNLLTNAVKFTERGGVSVEAAYRADAGLLRVAVSDTGIGVPPDRIGALFDRFTQADASTTRRYGGTGLGLAISKRLTDLMGGRIGAEARAGGGSTFWFELPLARHEGRLARPSDAVSDAGATERRRLLLAEDNAISAEVIAAMLAGRGYQVSTVSDGAAAVAAAQDPMGFDLILMDLQMPVMDGLSAARTIRLHERDAGTAPTPIVGLTANALAEDAALCLAAGMDAHVAKPVDWARLHAVMDELIGRGRRRDPSPAAAATPAEVLEPAKLEELSALIGRDRVTAMVVRFVDDLRTRFAHVGSGGEADLSQAVHMLAATAGQFGFGELSALCAEADVLLRKGAKFDRIAELRAAADRAAAAAARSGFATVAPGPTRTDPGRDGSDHPEVPVGGTPA